MRTHLSLSFFLLLFTLTCTGQDDETIRQLVSRWSELHNTRETVEFKSIYAPNVLFYGGYKTGKKCYELKHKYLTPDFNHQIITPVSLTYYSSGTVKCDFTKRVTYKSRVKDHPSYLLVEQKDGEYLITGEGDVATDKRLSVSLDLGSEIPEESLNSNNIFIYVLTVAAIFVTIFILYKRRQNRSNTELNEFYLAHPVIQEPTPVENPKTLYPKPTRPLPYQKQDLQVATATLYPHSVPLAPKDKGDAFEKYVVERFKREYFQLLEWRGDKYHEGIYASSTCLPDLEYQFTSSYCNLRFAVECKWRAEFYNGSLEWAKHRQLVTYGQYSRERNIPVFIIIGVGGQPDAPAAVYIIPLWEIQSNILQENQMQQYYRHRRGDFYLNPDRIILE